MPILKHNMEISKEEILNAFGRGLADSPSGALFQVFFLPSQIDTSGTFTHYTAFCPFTGITARGPSIIQAYKSWLSEASQYIGIDHPLQFDQIQADELLSKKLSVGEIQLQQRSAISTLNAANMNNTTMSPMTTPMTTPVYIIECGEREAIICPYKSEIAIAEKNSNNPVISVDGKEMKMPGFVVDHRVACTAIQRYQYPSNSSFVHQSPANVANLNKAAAAAF